MKTIIHTVHIHSPPDVVFRALTTEAGVTGWWTTEAAIVVVNVADSGPDGSSTEGRDRAAGRLAKRPIQTPRRNA